MSISIEIEYCVPCGHLDRAVDLQKAILTRFGQKVDGVRLKTGEKGVFNIRVDDELIHDKTKAFEPDRIIEDIGAKL